METETLNEKENSLFNRKEIQINMNLEATPSYEQAKKFIAEKFSVSEDCIEIKKVDARFGKIDFIIYAHIYNSKEEKESIEPKPKQKTKA